MTTATLSLDSPKPHESYLKGNRASDQRPRPPFCGTCCLSGHLVSRLIFAAPRNGGMMVVITRPLDQTHARPCGGLGVGC